MHNGRQAAGMLNTVSVMRSKAKLDCSASVLHAASSCKRPSSPIRRRRALELAEIVAVGRHRCGLDACASKSALQWRFIISETLQSRCRCASARADGVWVVQTGQPCTAA